MRLDEILCEKTGLVWSKRGNRLVRKVRCAVGPRAGKLVKDPAECFAPKNLKKSMVLKRTKAVKGKRMSRKANKTKRFNPLSKLVKRLNK